MGGPGAPEAGGAGLGWGCAGGLPPIIKYLKMRITVYLVVLLLGWAISGRAQFLGGIFSQGATELKDYGEQIVALQMLLSQTDKGYQVVGQGLDNIGGINQGEYGLHTTYFGSLAAVNPAVAGMPEVGEIIDLETSNLNGFSAAVSRWNVGGGLTAGELSFVGQVYSNVGRLGLQVVTELQDLLTPDKLTMTDDGRMARIRALDVLVKDQYAFVQAFSARVDGLVGERVIEAGGVGVMKGVYGAP